MVPVDVKHHVYLLKSTGYDILPPTSATDDYVTGLEKLAANGQFFDDAQMAVS